MKKIVFDYDGTLLDSSQRHIEVLRDSLDKYGCVFPIDENYLSFKANGKTTIQFLEKSGLSKEVSWTISMHWVQKIEDPKYLAYDVLYNDAIRTLTACKQRGHLLYLLSARSNERTYYKQVESLCLEPFFEKVICVSPANAAKEKYNWLKMIGADIMVGDTEVDYEASKNANIDSYILNRGFRSRKFWEEKNIINTYDSLSPLLKKI